MARVLRNTKKQRNDNCIELLNYMKDVIEKDLTPTNVISGGKTYNTECSEWKSFVEQINKHTEENKMIITYPFGENVDHIKTNVDIHKDRVHYKFSKVSF